MPLTLSPVFWRLLLVAVWSIAIGFGPARAAETVAFGAWPQSMPFPKVRAVKPKDFKDLFINNGLPSSDRRVVGIAFLDDGGRPRICSGLYIDAHHVLTAKHCTCHRNTYAVTNDNDMMDRDAVWTGAWLERGNQGGAACSRLADFNLSEGNDIALLTLDQPLPINKAQAPTCDSYSLLQNVHLFDLWRRWGLSSASISGFGRDLINGGSQTMRRFAKVKINSPDCRVAAAQALGCVAFREMILGLSVSSRERTDSCIGDSGGTAYLEYQNEMVPIGIVSRSVAGTSRQCGAGGVYTMLGRADVTAWLNRRLTASNNPTCGTGNDR